MTPSLPIPVFDGHNDALTKADHAGFATGRPHGDLDLPRMRAGGMRGGIFAIFTPSQQRGQPVELLVAAEHANAAARRLFDLERAGLMRIARSIADVDAAGADDGPPVAVLSLEGAEAIDPGLEALDVWHTAGLRSLGPVWSRPNAFAHGVPLNGAASDVGPGLTDAGRALVARCAGLGIVVDLSHMNAAGFWDVARLEAGPLVASHSGVHALCASARNLTDAQLDAIGASDGLVGIVFGPAFLRPDREDDVDTPVSLIATHARYVADRIGVRHVALGSDFDGMPMPRALDGAAGLPLVLEALADAGFSADELAAVAWGNWRRVLQRWWGT